MARTLLERFTAKVDRSGDCWLWTASRFPEGYGKIQVDGQSRLAHRIAYELLVGPIPEGLQLDHLCRNRGCVNPAHLEPVTCRENLRRGFGMGGRNAHKTHCPLGHSYDRQWKTGPADCGRVQRYCSICRRASRQRSAGKAVAT